MKKLILTLALFAFPTASAVDYSPSPEECQRVSIGFYVGAFYATYKTDAVFPNPPKYIGIQEGDSLNCRTFAIGRNSNLTTFKASNKEVFDRFFKVQKIDLLFHSYYKYPAIKKDIQIVNVSMDMNGDFKINGDDVSLVSGKYVPSFFGDVVAGYKLNDGDLKPLIYAGLLTPFKQLSETDKIDIFFMPNKYAPWQRVTIDKVNLTVDLYKSADFPK